MAAALVAAAGDQVAFAGLVATPDVDWFLVADEWFGRFLATPTSGELLLAQRLGTLVSDQPAWTRLRSWIDTWPALDDAARAREAGWRAALATAQASNQASRHAMARDQLGPVLSRTPEAISVTWVRLLAAHAEALAGVDLPAQAMAEHRVATAAAERLGWLVEAVRESAVAGTLAAQSGEFDPALRDYERCLELNRACGRLAGVAEALAGIGAVQARRRDFDRALDALAEAGRVRRQLGDLVGAAELLADQGSIESLRGEHDRALVLFRRSRQELLELGDTSAAARKLGSMAVAHLHAGRSAEALEWFERACQEAEARGDQQELARNWQWRGECHQRLHQLVPALTAYERARAACLSVGARAAAAACLAHEGDLRTMLGQHALAAECHVRVLREWEALGDRAGIATTLGNLGLAYGLLGEFARGLDLLERALQEHRVLAMPTAIAADLDNLGILHARLGNLERALLLHQEAAATQDASGDVASLPISLNNAACVLEDLGRTDEAVVCYERALALEDLAGNRAAQARILNNLGVCRTRLGQFDRAMVHHQQALALRWGLGDLEGQAMSHDNMGLVHAGQGRLTEALQCMRKALALEEQLGTCGELVVTLGNIAELHLRSGRHQDALEAARRCQDLRLREARGVGDTVGARHAGHAARAGEVALSSALAILGQDATRKDPVVTAAFAACEASRCQFLVDALQRRRVARAASVPPELLSASVQARAALQAAREEMAQAVVSEDAARTTAARAALAAAYRGLEDALARNQRATRRGYEGPEPEPVALKALQETLPLDSVLVLYQVARDRLLAMVVGRDFADLVDLGAAAEVGDRVVTWQRVLRIPQSQDHNLAAALYQRLVRPLEPRLAGKGRLIIAPDSFLSFLPFEALLREDGLRGERLIERWEVTYTPSATVLVTLLRAPRHAARGEGLLAVGDPIYPGEAERGTQPVAPRGLQLRGLGALPRLRGSGEEVRAIAGRFGSERRVLLTRAAAAREGVLAALAQPGPRWRAIHIACHGHVDPQYPCLTGLVFGEGAILTADDLSGLDLDTDLVVLSACESGRGATLAGEGVMGLARACLCAGAPRVVVANWQVPDAGTCRFMACFYEALVPGALSAAAALRKASLTSLRGGGSAAHPSQWAAFALWGRPD